ncbi:MAG: ParB/RepB/Spo0J family partition protein [Mycoplasmatales bacterium]
MAKKGLKRGLDYLFDENSNFSNESSQDLAIENILISDIAPNPYQPRKVFDEIALNELAQSIKENGVFQPILLRKSIIGYEIISGERRYRASKIAGLEEIPALIYEYDDKQMMEVALIENIQREDLNVVEEADSYASLIEQLGYTQEQLAKKLGKSRSHIANILRINNLAPNILEALKNKEISLGHAKVLLGVKEEDKRAQIFTIIIKENLNVRQTEQLIKEQENAKEKIKTPKIIKESNYRQLEDIMIDKLATKVNITGKGKGQIKIDYSSEDDLERLLELLKLV